MKFLSYSSSLADLPRSLAVKAPVRGRGFSGRRGFTLIELLLVISLIVILVGITATYSSRLATGQPVRTATNVLRSQIATAQTLAKNRSVPACVLIYNRESPTTVDLDFQLRYTQVVYLGTDDDGNFEWIPESNGITLPPGVYFSPDYSEGEISLDDATLSSFEVRNDDGDLETVQAIAPSMGKRFPASPQRGDWIAYGFSSTGSPINELVDDRLDVIVQGRAALDADGNIEIRGKGARNKVSGFFITNYGNSIEYRDAAHIGEVIGEDLIGEDEGDDS